jgi:hypothetical protein
MWLYKFKKWLYWGMLCLISYAVWYKGLEYFYHHVLSFPHTIGLFGGIIGIIFGFVLIFRGLKKL